MHIRASVASTAHKTVTLRKIILPNYDTTEFETALFAVSCQTPDIFRIFWPKDLMALLWKIGPFTVHPAEGRATFGCVR